MGILRALSTINIQRPTSAGPSCAVHRGDLRERWQRPKPGNHGLFKGNYPQMAELFRLVNYYNLPIYI